MLRVARALRARLGEPDLPAAAKSERTLDREQGLGPDLGIDACVAAALAWLERAHDLSASQDGGVARSYNLVSGWQPSYPETTGYIIPTLIEHAKTPGNGHLRQRAQKMLDWLVSIQFPEGGFQGGVIGAHPVRQVAFNTGQILIGLCAGEREFGLYRASMLAASDWLVRNQEANGSWHKSASPFAMGGVKTFDTHIAWGLFEAERLAPGKGYGAAACANLRWAQSLQNNAGWFHNCCLNNFDYPLTHTIGYALRGFVEGFVATDDRQFLGAAVKTADGLLTALRPDGFLPGRLRADWSADAKFACLTGSVQIAYCWLRLYQLTGNKKYQDAAIAANRYVRRTVKLHGDPASIGGVKGSFPVDGDYSPFEYPNWAAKFLIDSLTLERQIQGPPGV